MPSYRVSLTVGLLRPGVDPEAVLPTAADAARELTTVEAADVGVVRGEARITVRFLAGDDDAASGIARTVRAQVARLADASALRITRRYGGRWYRVAR